MERRRSLAVLLVAVAVTCGSVTVSGQATAKDKAPDPLCYDLLTGGTARYLAPVDINATTQNVKSLDDGGTGVFLEGHNHQVSPVYVTSGGVLDAESGLGAADCAGATYAVNVYDLASSTLLASFTGMPQGSTVRFFGRVSGKCVGVEMVSHDAEVVVDASPNRRADGTPDPVKVCTPDGSGAGSFSG